MKILYFLILLQHSKVGQFMAKMVIATLITFILIIPFLTLMVELFINI